MPLRMKRGTNNYIDTVPSKPGCMVTLAAHLPAILDLHISLEMGFQEH